MIARRRVAAVAAAVTAATCAVGVAFAAQDPPTPTISGEPRVGETLTASEADLYRWQRCDPEGSACGTSGEWSDIPGAQGQEVDSYTLTGADLGLMIRVLAKYTSLGSQYHPSAAVGPVVADQPSGPVNTAPPSISGDAVENETLTGDDGEWTGLDLTFTRQWQRSTETRAAGRGAGGYDDIPGADGTTYELTLEDVGHTIRLEVTASGPGGSATAFSDPTDEVELAPPTFDKNGNLDPISGTVLAQLPGEDEIRRIEELTRVPLGTTVDVSDGFVDLTTQRGPSEALQTITLWDGTFVLGQRLKKRLTVLKLSENLVGGPTTRSAEAQASARRGGGRRLWGRGRCRCRTRGRNSSGTARGTHWLTAERKRGTFTKVKEGAVVVRDFTSNKKVLVKAGERYLAPKH